MAKVYMIMAALVLLGLLTVKILHDKNVDLRLQITQANLEIETLKEMAERNSAALVQLHRSQANNTTEFMRLNKQLAELRETDNDIQEYLIGIVPADIERLLNENRVP